LGYIQEPKKIPFWLKFGISVAEKKTGKIMEPARLLSWYPKSAFSSGILESLVTHEDSGISKRLLQLIRLQVSISVNCRFCIDMNGNEFEQQQITPEEIEALQGRITLDSVPSFSHSERIALRYTRNLTDTPASEDAQIVEEMKQVFNERQFVIIATTMAQVNYWTRLIKGLGIPPAGFRKDCSLNEKVEEHVDQ
jgi:AhpD family alkylhydroperoxidase